MTASVLLLAAGVPKAAAEAVALIFEGETIAVDDPQQHGLDPLDPSIVPGASFSVTLSHDPATEPDLWPEDPNEGPHSVETALTGQVGSVVFDNARPPGDRGPGPLRRGWRSLSVAKYGLYVNAIVVLIHTLHFLTQRISISP